MKKSTVPAVPGKLRCYVRNSIRVAVHPVTQVEFVAYSPAAFKSLLQKLLGFWGPMYS